jgi:pimeloyl-ACP methyl ester carboxylesterase
VPYTYLKTTPLIPTVSPVTSYYRTEGEGESLLILHGGWGYGVYPFDRQIEVLRTRWKVIIPDRGGYGRSTHISQGLPSDFHYLSAKETLAFLDSLNIQRTAVWGHSGGAVIGAIAGIMAPDRISGLILESFHYYGAKNHSRAFYEQLAYRPETLGESLCGKFAAEHGQEYWKTIISSQGKAWLDIGEKTTSPDDDLYGGALQKLAIPSLFIHGRNDPRTEPGELEAVRRAVQKCDMRILNPIIVHIARRLLLYVTTKTALQFLQTLGK